MTQQTKVQPQNPKHPYPTPLEKTNMQKQKAEELEVAGKHKNVGQKDHKGAR